jgi:lipopolysaccharide export system protein LptA
VSLARGRHEISGARLPLAFLLLGVLLLGAGAETFRFSADRVESVMAKGKERTVLSGRARVTSGSLLISADRIEISGSDFDILECAGKVVADDEERGIHLEAPSLRYERKAKRAVMIGASILEDRKNRVVLKAMRIEDDGTSEVTVAEAAVRILKDELACRAEFAVYRRAEDSLELTGSPRVWRDGDEFRATRIVVNTKTEEFRLEGAVEGKVRGDEAAPPAEKAPPAEGKAAP